MFLSTDYKFTFGVPAAGNGFPNNGFQRGGRNGGPPNFRGGQRGGRGANNSGAMQNGFNNRPSSGNNRGGRGL